MYVPVVILGADCGETMVKNFLKYEK